MVNLETLNRDLDAKRQEGLALIAKYSPLAEKEDRLLNDEEMKEINAVTEAGKKIQARINQLRGIELVQSQLEALAPQATKPAPRVMKSLGEQFTAAPEYDFFRKGLHRSSSAWRSPSQELFLAATLTTDGASGGDLIVPEYIPGIMPTPTRRLVVADLFASGTTDSNQVAYMQEVLFTNAAAPVLEGAAKPESTLTFNAVTDAVRKIAHWLPVTEEMLEDVAQIRSYIDARLRLGVQLAEEDQLLNGDGVAPNLLGIRQRVGLTADVVRGVAENNADAIFRQIMAVYAASFLMPTGVVLNPADWATTALMKTTTGEYISGGPFNPIGNPTLWGLTVAVTPVMTATVALVGAFQQGAQIFRKGGIRVEASNSHSDYFIKNLVAIRAEERLALAVYRPAAFGEVTSLGVPA